MKTNVKSQQVRFKLSDAKAYDEKALTEAFKGQAFPDASVAHKPAELSKSS